MLGISIWPHYDGANRQGALLLDFPYLRYPSHQSIFILPNEWAEMIKGQLDFMNQNLYELDKSPCIPGFYSWEVDIFARIYELMITKTDSEYVTTDHKDFVAFVDEHDRRRDTNFLETFPEYTDLYYKWKNKI